MSTAVNSTLKALVIAAAASGLVVLASRLTVFKDFDRYTYDTSIDHVGLSPPSKDIVLIDFDEESFQRIQQFPIPRSIIADAVRRIGAAKPRVIGIDLFLSEPRTRAEDKAMQDALTGAQVVILASQTGNGNLPPVTPMPQFCQPEDSTSASGFCVEGKPGALGYAFVNLPTDDDGFQRQANLFSAGSPPALSFPSPSPSSTPARPSSRSTPTTPSSSATRSHTPTPTTRPSSSAAGEWSPPPASPHGSCSPARSPIAPSPTSSSS